MSTPVRIVLFAFGLLICVGAAANRASNADGAAAGLFMAMIGGLIGGMMMLPLVLPFLADTFYGFFFPTNAAEAPPEFTKVRNLVSSRNYEEAAEELRKTIAEKPTQIEAKGYLVRILYEHLDGYDEAIKVAMTELRSAKAWHSEHERLIMAVTDIAIERGDRALAREALRRGLELTHRTGPAAQSFQERLSNLG